MAKGKSIKTNYLNTVLKYNVSGCLAERWGRSICKGGS